MTESARGERGFQKVIHGTVIDSTIEHVTRNPSPPSIHRFRG